MAEEIKKRLFTFEDIILLSDRANQLVLREVEPNELAKAMHATGPQASKKIFRNMSSQAADLLKNQMDEESPVRIEEVEAAQQRIFGTIRKLEERGVISVPRKSQA